jgi:cyclic pyranopterin phosphate synthase
MKDLFGREIEYLRLSVTNKCNLNCSYCKRSDDADGEIITFNEIEKIVDLFSKLGIKKIRLTGGEPLIREDILEIISLCKNKYGVKDVALTTNGILLANKSNELKNAGLDRVNISIDSLDSAKYTDITRANSLSLVFKGIEKALEVGLKPLKINVVLMKDKNEDEIDSFIALAKENEIEVRFIEYMPMGKKNSSELFVSKAEILSGRPYLIKSEDNGVAQTYSIDGFKGKIGFISPISEPFCKGCNKIRITADCKLRFCLGDNSELDLRKVLHKENALEILKNAILNKPQKGFCEGFITNRGMGNIGG